MAMSALYLGDFNAKHPMWDKNTKKPKKKMGS